MAAQMLIANSSLFHLKPHLYSHSLSPPSLILQKVNSNHTNSFNPIKIHSSTWKPMSAVATGSDATIIFSESVKGQESGGVKLDFGGGDVGGGDSGKGFGGGGGGGGGDDEEDGDGEDEVVKKNGMSMSQKLTLGYAALIGFGGLMGYLKSGSVKSLAAGGISASLLLFVYSQLPVRPALASAVGLGLSAALLVVMGSRFKKSGKVFPAGVVSLVSFIMTGGYFHGLMRGH